MSSQVTYRGWNPVFLEMEHLPLMPYFAFLTHAAFALPFKLTFISTHKFPNFYPSNILSHPPRGEQASDHVGRSCLLGLSHDIDLKDFTVWSDRGLRLGSEKGGFFMER